MGTPQPHTPYGLRISRVPCKPVHRDEDGNLTIPLWLERDGRFDADLSLRLSPAEAEHLHAQLCRALDGMPVTTPPAHTPDCRRDVRGSRGVHWP
ncbi:hypothetical protein [Streptomyces orinoci]|uniref:Uncharacterized protein n=1 Tax=Streptomyces orinoci TaxID=67339 RepID=A0ABV3K1D5_STRON|nr:hypothetical protein [Streptomyces orinoci]